jgi:oxygen-independent coproporphyrinogen-3 oxidase
MIHGRGCECSIMVEDTFISNKKVGLYIHVPFCRSKCYYCDFNSFPHKDSLIPAYFDALEREIYEYAEKIQQNTVFIGGGTPSYIDACFIKQVLKACNQNFNICSCAEITIEANPGTLCEKKLESYRESGINRISIGLQAWQEKLLKRLGRTHTLDDYIQNFRLARKEGFDNINTDLIFGIPGQTTEEWRETIENVSNMGVEHISCYSLKIEDGTIFGEMLSRGQLAPMEDEQDREMYYLTKEILGKAGYKHYEISNFAKPDYECKHNLIYWKPQPYVGIGAGAHSYLEGKRFNNIYNPEKYIECIKKGGISKENIEFIDRSEAISEYMILGLPFL